MLAQRIAPDPARAGWLSGSRALVVMQGEEKVSPKGVTVSPTRESLRDSRTDWSDERAKSRELNGANCTVDGCQRPSCVSPDEHAQGVPHLCAGCFDDVGFGLGGAA
jgi:hypothetical protein